MPSAPGQAPTTTPELPVATVESFALSVTKISNQCFDSAGCSVEYEVKVGMTGGPVKPGRYRVFYTVDGSDYGPEDGSFVATISADGTGTSEGYMGGNVSTSAHATLLTATITQVEVLS